MGNVQETINQQLEAFNVFLVCILVIVLSGAFLAVVIAFVYIRRNHSRERLKLLRTKTQMDLEHSNLADGLP